jgi:hypothetical protein
MFWRPFRPKDVALKESWVALAVKSAPDTASVELLGVRSIEFEA